MKTVLSVAAIAAMLAVPVFAAEVFAAETAKPGVEAPIVGAPAAAPTAVTPAETAPLDPAAAPVDPVVAPDAAAAAPKDAISNDATANDATPKAEKPILETAKVPPADANSAGKVVYLQSQDTNQFLASRIIGASVVNTSDETVGDVNDIVFDKEGKVISVVIGVGGFLGMGEQNVAVAFNQSLISTDVNGTRIIKLNVTKDTLKDATKYVKLVDKAS